MDILQWLESAANVGSIVTAIVAASLYVRYIWGRHQKRLRLESYLKSAKEKAGPMESAQRTPLQLMAALGITEAEIVDLSFRSSRIKRVAGTVFMGQDPIMALEYQADNPN